MMMLYVDDVTVGEKEVKVLFWPDYSTAGQQNVGKE